MDSYVPYRDVLHPTIRSKLVIDPKAAEVVRKIFLVAIDRHTSNISQKPSIRR